MTNKIKLFIVSLIFIQATTLQGQFLGGIGGGSATFLLSGTYTGGSTCINPSSPGSIGTNQTICAGTFPAQFTNLQLPQGHVGPLEYKWQVSTVSASSGFVDIPSSNAASFQVTNLISQNSWFRRLTKVECLTEWPSSGISNVISVTINEIPWLTSQSEPAILTESLVLRLDAATSGSYSGTGNTWFDISGQNNHATLVNNPGFTSENGGAITFNGVNQHLSISNISNSFAQGLSVFTLAKVSVTRDWSRIIDFGQGQANNNLILANSGNSQNFFFEIRNGGDGIQRIIRSNANEFAPSPNNKSIAAVAEGGTPGAPTTGKLFYNGNQINIVAAGQSLVVPPNATRNSNFIGRSNWSGDQYFEGNIQMILMYSRALTNTEIRRNYNATAHRHGLPPIETETTLQAQTGFAFVYNPTSNLSGVNFSWSRAAVAGIQNSASNGSGSINENLINTSTEPILVRYVYTLSRNGCTNEQVVLVKVAPCTAPTSAGIIGSNQTACSNTIPSIIQSLTDPSGASESMEYKWRSSTTSSSTGFADIQFANDKHYQPGRLSQTTWFRRLAKANCQLWGEAKISNVVQVTVNPALLFTSTIESTLVTDGLVMHFDAALHQTYPAGVNTWYDLSGNSINAKAMNGVSYSSDNSGQFVFDGIDDHFQLAPFQAGFTNGGLIQAFVRVEANQHRAAIIDFGVGKENHNIHLFNKPGENNISLEVFTPGNINSNIGSFHGQYGASAIFKSLATRFDPGTAGQLAGGSIFWNGNAEPLFPSQLRIPHDVLRGSNFIGRSHWVGDPWVNAQHFKGGMSIKLFYNRTLSNNEVRSNHNLYAHRFGLPYQSTSTTFSHQSGAIFAYTPTSNANNATFSWSRPGINGIVNTAATGSGNISEQLINNSGSAIIVPYFLTQSANGCTSSALVLVNVQPCGNLSNGGTINASASNICIGSDAGNIQSISAPTGNLIVNYKWQVSITGESSGFTDIPNTNSSTYQPGILSQTSWFRRLARTACATNWDNPSISNTVQINALPKPEISNKTSTICSGSVFYIEPLSNGTDFVPAGTTYTWIVSSNTNVVGQSNQNNGQAAIQQTLVNLTHIAQTLTYTVTPAVGASGCEGNTFTVTVTINPKPSISNQTISICSGSTFTVNPANGEHGVVPEGTAYVWTVSGNSNVSGSSSQSDPQTIISQSLTNLTNTAESVEYTVTPTSGVSGNCAGSSFTVMVIIDPSPSISDITTTICSGETLTISPINQGGNIVPSETKYTWTVSSNSNITGQTEQSTGLISISQTLVNLTNTPQTLTLTVTPTRDVVSSLEIGQQFQGGQVAYIYPPGSTYYEPGYFSGLVVANNRIARAPWGCMWTWIFTSQGAGSGMLNTIEILNSCQQQGIAAQLAREYDGGDFDDWYLPSLGDLQLINSNKTLLSGIEPDYYSSSSQLNEFMNWGHSISPNINSSIQTGKNSSLGVLPVRNFRIAGGQKCTGNPFTITVTVNPLTVAGSLSGAKSIDLGQSTGIIQLSNHVGNVLRWERRIHGLDWEAINHTGTTYSEEPWITGLWEYRAVVKSGQCAKQTTDPHRVFVTTVTNWTGVQNNNWFQSGNWDNGVPTIDQAAIIGPTINQPILSGPSYIYSLIINPGASLTLDAVAMLELTGPLVNNAGVNGLVMKSNEQHSASLIHNTNDVDATLEKYIPGGGYHLASIPLTQTSNPLASQFMHSYVFRFDAASNPQQWLSIGNDPNTPMDVTQGYMIWYTGNEVVYRFRGKLNNGPFTVMTNSGASTFNNSMYEGGYNLIPNPYPSPIDWNSTDGYSGSNTFNSIWIYNRQTGNYGAYQRGFEMGTNNISNIIGTGQSFFVQATAIGNPALTINNKARKSSNNPIHKNIATTNVLLIRATRDTLSDETIFRLNSLSTQNFETEFDAQKMYSSGRAPQLASLSSEGIPLSINSFAHETGVTSIPMSLKTESIATINLQAIGVENFYEHTDIFLEDIVSRSFIDLKKQAFYQLENGPGHQNPRFILHFQTVTSNSEKPLGKIRAWYLDKKVYVSMPDNFNNDLVISFYSVDGRLLSSSIIKAASALTIIDAKHHGLVICEILSSDRKLTFKYVAPLP